MIKVYQPKVDKKNLKPGTKVMYWVNHDKNGKLTIKEKCTRKWKMNIEYYYTEQGVRLSEDSILYVIGGLK